ncbi:hypothetical protein MNBD_GAMMA01-73 [hydrothermal vent metagenome]|uniref:Tripartite ATP-independent periplasmic transporters DctQ component domain-containing protein n=1 Tax=hydrothermal vent metagenome TaxID=652676 RepID=A0A3B0VFK4_9ZZZZ
MKKLGFALGILILVMIVLSFISVAIRYTFNIVLISLQELIIYLHATVFMLGIVYTYHHDKHVRIDIFYQNYTPAKQKMINTFGTLFLLLPFFGFMFYASYNYVLSAWLKLESSPESGGLPFVYGLKTLLLIMPATMIVFATIKMLRKS